MKGLSCKEEITDYQGAQSKFTDQYTKHTY